MRFFIIILIGFLLISPVLTNAISPESVTPENIAGGGVIKDVSAPTQVRDVSGIVGIVASVVKWIYIIFFIIAVMYVLFAAFAYLSEGDDAEKMKAVHNRIKYAAIAIAVALMAIGLEMIIKNFLITEGDGRGANTGDYWRINPGGNLPIDTDSWRWYPFQKGNQPSPPPVLPESL
ncbi:MAG: hypothetical protein Q8N28_03050 [bacterium]|nr:hypothetical protein [bacterium]